MMGSKPRIFWDACPDCEGSGIQILVNTEDAYKEERCPTCKGKKLLRGTTGIPGYHYKTALHLFRCKEDRRPDLRHLMKLTPPTGLPLRWLRPPRRHEVRKEYLVRFSKWSRPHWAYWQRSITEHVYTNHVQERISSLRLNGGGYDPEYRFDVGWREEFSIQPRFGAANSWKCVDARLEQALRDARSEPHSPGPLVSARGLSYPKSAKEGQTIMEWLDERLEGLCREAGWRAL